MEEEEEEVVVVVVVVESCTGGWMRQSFAVLSHQFKL
jgi:hypothetical protein